MTTFTSRNVPLAEVTDPADIAARLNPVAQLQHDRPGVSALTTTQRNALTGAELWDGRIILNTTTDRLNRYDLGTTTWVAVADHADIATLLATAGLPAATPAAAGVLGVSTSAARSDHVHPAPVWQAYTPALTGATLGNGTMTGGYVQFGKTVHFWAKFVFGSTSVMGGFCGLGLPVTARSADAFAAVLAIITDSGVTNYIGFPGCTTTAVNVYAVGSGGTYAAVATMGPTAPFTWTAADFVDVHGTYEAA